MGVRSPNELVISERYRGHIIEAHIGKLPDTGRWSLRIVIIDGGMCRSEPGEAPGPHPSLAVAVEAAFATGRNRVDVALTAR